MEGSTPAGEGHPPLGPLSRSPGEGAARAGGGSGGQGSPRALRLLRRERGTGRRGSLQQCRPGAGSGGGAGALLPAAAARDSPALFPEDLPGRAASHPGGRRRRPQDKRPGAKTLPGKGAARPKYFSRDFSPLRRGSAPCRTVAAGAAACCGGGAHKGGRVEPRRGGEGRQHPPGEVRRAGGRGGSGGLKGLPRKGATQTCGRPPSAICRAVGAKRRCQGLFISRRSGGSGSPHRPPVTMAAAGGSPRAWAVERMAEDAAALRSGGLPHASLLARASRYCRSAESSGPLPPSPPRPIHRPPFPNFPFSGLWRGARNVRRG